MMLVLTLHQCITAADTDAQADADRRPGREESDPDKQHVAE